MPNFSGTLVLLYIMCIIPVLMHAGEKESLRALILSEEKAWFRAKMVLLLEKVKKM